MEQELSGTIITCTKGGESRTGAQLGQPRGAQVAAGRHRDRAPAGAAVHSARGAVEGRTQTEEG
jgi:hypothetical protein